MKWEVNMTSGIKNLIWGEPYQDDKDGWKRECLIPVDVRSNFFIYWKSHGFVLKSKGYTVTKRDNDWYLIHSTDYKEEFDKSTTPTPKSPLLNENFILPPSELKFTDGLRPWQLESVSKLCSVIKNFKCAIDGSDMGCHAKGQLILMADGQLKPVETIKIGESIMGWKGPQSVTELYHGREKMVRIVPHKRPVVYCKYKSYIDSYFNE